MYAVTRTLLFILTCPGADCWLANLMACVISSSVIALNWSLRSLLVSGRFAGFVLAGGAGKRDAYSRLHFSSKLLWPSRA